MRNPKPPADFFRSKFFRVVSVLFMAAALAASPSGPADLEQARKHTAQAQAFIEAYYDQVILPRKTPTQTSEARKMRLSAWAEAEKAVRIFEAHRAGKKGLAVSDRVLAGTCRLIMVDTNRPAMQDEKDREALLQTAHAEFSELRRLDPKDPEALAGLIEVHRLRMDRAAGLAALNEADGRVGLSPGLALAAGRFLLEMEDPEGALSRLKQAEGGSDYRFHLYLAAALHMSGDAEGAKREARSALRLRPSCEAASFLIEHIEAYNAVRQGRSPGHRGSRHLLAAGVAFAQRGDHSLSIHFYERSVEAMPEDARALYILGDSLAYRARLLGHKEEARRAASLLSKAMARGGMPDVTREAALIPLAMAYETAGDFEKAAATYRTVVESDPSYYRFYRDLARCYQALGRKKQSEQAMAKYDELKPKTGYVIGVGKDLAEERIGTSVNCENAAELERGEGRITGRLIAPGLDPDSCEVQLLLDDCARVTAPAAADREGRFEILMPAGSYTYNGLRAACPPGRDGARLSDMVYLPGRLEALYELTVGGPGALSPAPPGRMEVKSGDNPGLSFEARFAPRLEVVSPRPNEKLRLAEAQTRTLSWRKIPGAADYRLNFYEVRAGGLIPLRERLSWSEPGISIADLFTSALMSPTAGDYAVVIEAVDEGGRVIARSEGALVFSVE